ncbi:MAG: hypothetical protein COB81_06625 [Flavobacteriaceae bacterium]|nr:MAG: hypothetical protein COB81_06625 [Flavobacteriaceae bacterium]
MKKRILIGLVVIFGIIACNNNDDSNNCNQVTIVSSEQYETAPNDQLFINTLELNGDCLKINFSSSGCNGDTWVLKLIDSENIMESNPPQRNLRLSLRNEEDCEAFITRELTFDVNELRVNGNQVLLNITNSDDQILYEY